MAKKEGPFPVLGTELEGYDKEGADGKPDGDMRARGGAMHMKEEHKEHEKKAEHKRARGGKLPEALKEHDEEEEEEAEHKKRARGGHIARKHGGHVEGKAPMHRPDKRARGGATSDANPLTSAGNMSHPSFERTQEGPYEGGKGADRD
jgi:hypothetical protein